MKIFGYKVVVVGLSFGGYYVVNFVFCYFNQVSYLFSMSGVFDIKLFLDGYYDENVYFNNLVDFLLNVNDLVFWGMKIILGILEWDICLEVNKMLFGILNVKGIDYWLDVCGW